MTSLAVTSGLALDGLENAEVADLAYGLAGAGSPDDPEWQDQARPAGCRLPSRLVETLRRFRHDPGPDGFLTVANLPLGGPLPPTPAVPDSVERRVTVPAAVVMLAGLQLGEVIAYRDEKHGALVQNVVPVPQLASSQSNGGSVSLDCHTENAFHDNRPHYVGLFCLRAAHEDQVGTTVASIRHALPLLDEGTRTVLAEPRFATAAPPSFRSQPGAPEHAVLTGDRDDPDIRVDFHATRGAGTAAARALAVLREALDEVRVELALNPGDLAFLDNRLVVHGRVAFTPRYDGHDRWLHRIFVHLDHRRTRPDRVSGGAVLR